MPSAPIEARAGCVRRNVRRWRGGALAERADLVAEETPVALICNGEPYAVMMATPADLEDFALGFCLSEALIAAPHELERIEIRTLLEGIELRLTLPPARAAALAGRTRALPGLSGCGLCGMQTLAAAVRHPPPVGPGPRLAAGALQRALARLGALQPLNALTGATHAAAWAGVDGEIALLREDVGRHNALDKLIGACARAGVNHADGFALITSRASFEMVQKAATLGIAVLAAISAPTALAIHLAQSSGMTLIGFARADGYALYSHAERLGPAPQEHRA